MIVADSNLIAYLLIPSDKSALADAVLGKDPAWSAPLICKSELRNILALYMRHQGMTLGQARQTMDQAERLLSSNEYSVPSDPVLELTATTSLSAYDAEFVVLAKMLGVRLVTQDRDILKAAPTIALTPDTFIKRCE